MAIEISLNVNGEEHRVEVKPYWSLAYTLREKIGLTGTKMGCEMGTCGSCTVLLNDQPVFSCLKMAVDVEGDRIRTIESLETGDELHPLQTAFIEHHGMQCAYCTSGFIIAAKALLDQNPKPTELEVREAIGGHLCRCGTYARIVKSILAAAATMNA